MLGSNALLEMKEIILLGVNEKTFYDLLKKFVLVMNFFSFPFPFLLFMLNC